jgi:carbon storage regulator
VHGPFAETHRWFLQGKGIFTGALCLSTFELSVAECVGTRYWNWALSPKGYAAMLVLSRKKNESIVINNDITVTVVEIRGDKVRLGIVAPKEVPVHRREVFEAIHGKGSAPVQPSAEPAPATAKPSE